MLSQPLCLGPTHDVCIDYFLSLKHFSRSLIERDTWAANCVFEGFEAQRVVMGQIKSSGFCLDWSQPSATAAEHQVKYYLSLLV